MKRCSRSFKINEAKKPPVGSMTGTRGEIIEKRVCLRFEAAGE